MTAYYELDEINKKLIYSQVIKLGGEITDDYQQFYTYDEWCEYIKDNIMANDNSDDDECDARRYYITKKQLDPSLYEESRVETCKYINGKEKKSTKYINWELCYHERMQDDALHSIMIEGTDYYYYD